MMLLFNLTSPPLVLPILSFLFSACVRRKCRSLVLTQQLIFPAPYGIREGSRKLAKAPDPNTGVNQEIDGQV